MWPEWHCSLLIHSEECRSFYSAHIQSLPELSQLSGREITTPASQLIHGKRFLTYAQNSVNKY